MKFLTPVFCLCLWFSTACFGWAGPCTLVADTKSGLILESKNADVEQHPASLTKVMTLYLTFDALENGILSMNDPLPISEKAARQPKSKMYLKAGDTITVREAILGLIVKSANDAAVVLAEALAPSEEDFALMMTSAAYDLGLRHTTFKNASGLHHPEQVTTAKDMAILTIAMINHYPQYYRLFSTNSFSYHGKQYVNHNNVLRYYKGAEGLKTGYVAAVGYNIISTAHKNDERLVSVVLGQSSVKKRDKQAINLLDKGFKKISKQQQLFEKMDKNPLKQKALVGLPKRDLYLPIMKQSALKAKEVSLAYLKNNQNKGVLGVGSLEVDDLTTSEQGDKNTSWEIQVGAFGSERQALKQAQNALRYFDGRDKEIKTPFANNLYRARISGFETKQSAHNTCKRLIGKKIQCLPIAPVL